MSESIVKAERYIAENRVHVNPMYRPAYHCAPPVGWINDPNGFSYWRGQYHLFCQYYPYKPVWGPMHWGHWVSRDLVHWEWIGVALAPDSPFDDKGCFSGTAVADGDRLLLMYTGVHADADGRVIQEQCIASSTDGIHFEKWSCNPVIGARDLPADGSPVDFRDPRLIKTATGWRAIVANRGARNGRQLSFSSADLVNWKCDGVFLEDIGDMPECPDYFELGGKRVLLSCVINMPQDGLRFPSAQPAVWVLGEERDGRMIVEALEAADNGAEFYAPQTVRTPDGRRVMLGWMHMWQHESPTQYLGHGWCGMYTVPRELTVQSGRVYQQPLRELRELRGGRFGAASVQVHGETAIPGLEGRHYELDMTLEPDNGGKAQIRLMQTGDEYFEISYDPATRILTCDRSRGGYTMGADGGAEDKPYSQAVVPGGARELRLQVFVDACSVEVFVDGGAVVVSMLNYPKGPAYGIGFAGDFTINELSKWELAGV